MSRLKIFLVASTVYLLVVVSASAGQISGDYIETRSADVYTGPCFANGEVGLAGNLATIGWRIREGSWNGIALDGLKVVAVAKAKATLGDVYHDPYPAEAVLIVDDQATDDQKGALLDFAKEMAGRLLDNVVRIETATIQMNVGENAQQGSVELRAGDIAKVQTRALGHQDHFCGNEYVYYPPLMEVSEAMPTYTISDEYSGKGLNQQWRFFDKRSSFVGTFSR